MGRRRQGFYLYISNKIHHYKLALLEKQFLSANVLIIILGTFPMWCASPDSSSSHWLFVTMIICEVLKYVEFACDGLKWRSCNQHGSLWEDFFGCVKQRVAICNSCNL